jgi:predicted esterase
VPHGTFEYLVKDVRQKQVTQRVDEMVSVLQDITEMHSTTHSQIFGTTAPEAKIDIDQLVIAGHSFGGITALMTAAKLGKKCRACCVMDPWFYAYHEQFSSGEISIPDCPVQVISSERFHPTITYYDSW